MLLAVLLAAIAPAAPPHADEIATYAHVLAVAQVASAVEGDIRELHAAGDQRLAVGPGIGLLRRALGLVGRVGQRKDDRPLDMLGHGPDHALGEGASGGAEPIRIVGLNASTALARSVVGLAPSCA